MFLPPSPIGPERHIGRWPPMCRSRPWWCRPGGMKRPCGHS